MFEGFSEEAFGFLTDVRANCNNKEWFEASKQIYLNKLFYPMKELCSEVSAPFMKIGGMMSKTGRIYSDPNFPPYKKYRDTMWFIVKHEAYDWSKTPSLFFELSAEGAVFGVKITHPAAPVMEKFRQRLISDNGELLNLLGQLERAGFTAGGEEYKRPRPCPEKSAERYFQFRSFRMTETLGSDNELLYSSALAEKLIKVFEKLLPVNELFEAFASEAEAEKLAAKAAASQPPETGMPKAPDVDFMW